MNKKKTLVKPQEQAALPPRKSIAGEELLTLQMFLSAPDVGFEIANGTNKNVVKLQEVAKVGSFSLYNQFKPQDPAQAILAALSIQAHNATSRCLLEAAQTRAYPDIRDMNLRRGFEGAEIVVKLLDALERRRRQDPKGVTVGSVNVEAGGQAIVGHVETGGQRKTPKATNSHPEDTRDTKEAEE